MKTAGIEKFSKRLDEIFEQGNPTKAQILDAYNKFAQFESQPMPSDEEIEKLLNDYESYCKTFISKELIKKYIKQRHNG
jgi:hypothetical protein